MRLLGNAFHELVELLEGRLAAIQAGEPVPRLILLEAESGAGKSRVVRELYERLRVAAPSQTHDTRQGYWPPLEEGGSASAPGTDLLAFRKVIGPPPTSEFHREAGALPHFMWVSVQCVREPGGLPVPTLELMWPSLRAHGRFLAVSWRMVATAREQTKAAVVEHWLSELKDLGSEASMEALSKLLDAANVLIPGVGYVVSKGLQTGQALRRRAKTRADVVEGGALDAGLTPAEKIATELLRVTHVRLPLILVVEDAHLMDQGLADLLSLLGAPDPARPDSSPESPNGNKPLLVVCTAWPEGRAEDHGAVRALSSPVYQQWREEVIRPRHNEVRPRAEVIGHGGDLAFPRLEADDRAEIVRQFAPRTDPDTVHMLVENWPNPYVLQLGLTDRLLQQCIEDGAYQIAREDLAEMPGSIEDLYRRRWDALPENIQLALTLAAGAVPDPGEDPSVGPFVIEVVAAAAARSGLTHHTTPDRIREDLFEAIDPIAWARLAEAGADLAEFREWELAAVARSYYAKQNPARRKADFTSAVIDELVERIQTARGDGFVLDDGSATTLALARWLLALEPDRADAAAATAALTLADSLESAGRPREAIRILTQPDRLSSLPPLHKDTLSARGTLARLQAQAGRYEEAVSLARQLVHDCEAAFGPDHSETLDALSDLATVLDDANEHQQAIVAFRDLVERRTRALGSDHEQTIRDRANLAGALVGREHDDPDQLREAQIREAVAIYRDVLDHRSPAEAIDAQDLIRMGNLGWALSEIGEFEEAIRLLRQVSEETARRLGGDHPEALAFRANLGTVLGDAGEYAEAIEVLEDVLVKRERVLELDHPLLFDTRANLGITLVHSGLALEGVKQYRQVVHDCERVLGRDNITTLTYRANLAWALQAAGQEPEAIALNREVLTGCERLLGRFHGGTRSTRRNLAWGLLREGFIQEAIGLFEELVADHVALLGEDDPETQMAYAELEMAQEGQRDE